MCASYLVHTWLGSMVQKGKFSAGIESFVSTLNSVLLPTFGMPTMPICTQAGKTGIRHYSHSANEGCVTGSGLVLSACCWAQELWHGCALSALLTPQCLA